MAYPLFVYNTGDRLFPFSLTFNIVNCFAACRLRSSAGYCSWLAPAHLPPVLCRVAGALIPKAAVACILTVPDDLTGLYWICIKTACSFRVLTGMAGLQVPGSCADLIQSGFLPTAYSIPLPLYLQQIRLHDSPVSVLFNSLTGLATRYPYAR